MIRYGQLILANGRCMSPAHSSAFSFSAFLKRELRKHHLHGFWLPIVLYFILGVQYYQPNVGGIGIDLPFNLIGWGFTGIALSAGLWSLYVRGRVKLSKQIIVLGLLMSCLFIPFVFGNVQGQSSTWFRFIALPLIWLFLLLSLQYRVTQKTQIVVIIAILIGTSAQTIIGFAQMTVMEHHLPPFGHFQQTNLMGSYITTGIACMYWLFAVERSALRWRVLLAFTGICLLAGMVGAQLDSRATLPNGVIVAVAGSLYFLTKRKYAPTLLLVAFIAGWFANPLLMAANKTTIEPEVASLPRESTAPIHQNIEERIILYPQVVQMILNNPLTGVGYGSFESAYVEFSSQQANSQNNSVLVRHNMAHPHNEMLYWAVEGGIIASIAVLSIFILLFVWMLRKSLPHKVLVIALFFPLTGHIFIEYPLYSSLPHLLLLLIFVRLFVLSNANRNQIIHNSVAPLLRPLALLTGLGMVLFSATGLHTNKLVLDYEMAQVKSPAPYLKMINPFVHYERYWTNIMTHKAIAGVQSNHRRAVEDYIAWAENMVKMRPRKVYWENIIRLKQHLGEPTKQDCATYEQYFPPNQCSTLLKKHLPENR